MLNEILTNTNWLEPQINFLVWLQNVRVLTDGILDKFFLSLTTFGELFLPTVVMCLVYWCVDTKAGIYLLTVNNFSTVIGLFLKMTACIYRPWILNEAVHPQEQALKMAGSYSFPSGHSYMASSVWGGLAYLTRKYRFLCAFLIILVLTVGFSRLFLGVHTPQDVIVGLCIGFVLALLLPKLIDWSEQDKNRYLYILLAVDIISAIILYYVLTKTYPMDYVDGKLLVNPQNAQYITVIYFGLISGLINGTYLCRRFFPFEAKDASTKVKIARGIIGFILFYMLFDIIQQHFFFGNQKPYRYAFLYPCFVGFFSTAIYPFVFNCVFIKNCKLVKRHK